MDIPLALGLAARANAFFRGTTGRMEVLAGHPAFARFHDLTFVRQTGLGGEIVADASVPWFRRMRNEGVERVRPILTGLKFDKSVDDPWGLIAEGERGLEIWTLGIGRRFQGHDDAQPFRLTMTSARFNRWSLPQDVSVEEASAGLLRALDAAKAHLDEGGQTVAASAVGKFLALHEAESPEATGDLACVLPDVSTCARPLFASGVRVLVLLETTGWMTSADESTRVLAERLWGAARVALETAV